jgi:O6-methylguanine-DNA--protein-cysteine methyltransferase
MNRTVTATKVVTSTGAIRCRTRWRRYAARFTLILPKSLATGDSRKWQPKSSTSSRRRARSWTCPSTFEGPNFRRVWQALREIPVGATTTYKEIAAKIGSFARAGGG